MKAMFTRRWHVSALVLLGLAWSCSGADGASDGNGSGTGASGGVEGGTSGAAGTAGSGGAGGGLTTGGSAGIGGAGGGDAGMDAALDAPADAPDDADDGADGYSCTFDPSQPLAPPGTTGAGPHHYWNLDSTSGGITTDTVGGVSGALLGVPTTELGRVGSALHFPGSPTYVRFDDVLNMSTYDFSIQLWYRSEATTDGLHMLLSKGTAGSTTPANRGYFLRLGGGSLTFNMNEDGSSLRAIAPEPPRNEWHHVVAVLERARCSMRLYIDGAQSDEVRYETLGSLDTNTRFAMGALDRFPGQLVVNQMLIGSLDEVAIYYRALDVSEIQANYQGGLDGTPLL